MSEWKKYKLGDLAEITSSKRIYYSDYVSDGIRFYRSKEIIETSLGEASGEPLYISKEKYLEIKNMYGAPVDGELLISAVGERSGIPYVIKNLGEFYFKDGNLIWLRNISSELDINFFCYWLKSSSGQMSLDSIMIGSAQKALTIIGLKGLVISIPKIEIQIKITSLLLSLDNKIDLLHRQNKILEAIAETLFKQWFVEEENEGWEKKSLDEIAEYLNGIACQKYPPNNELDKLPVLKIKELRNGFTENSDWASTEIPEEYIIQNGDVIFSWSGSLMVKIWDGEKCILNQHLFKVTSPKYPKWFYYLWTKYYLDKFISIAESKSTTMGHIKREDLSNSIVNIPEQTLLKEINGIINPLFEKLIINNRQILSLIKLRDTLLPKLMSGELRVM